MTEPTLRTDSATAQLMEQILYEVKRVVVGQDRFLERVMVAMLAQGHLLVEGVPGLAKTLTVKTLANTIRGQFKRIQFTPDLLPSDIVGVSIYNQAANTFEFKNGPIFANVVLADEINRTTPRTQSALLEAMSEGHVSVDDATHVLDHPFMVIATQNPAEHYGTYPLPESQMDRFLLRISIGYPAKSIERDLLRDRHGTDPVSALTPVVDLAAVRTLQEGVESIRVDDALIDYAMTIIEETRRHPAISVGVSTRGALAWYRAAQAGALAAGRDFVVPDDVKSLAVPCLAHRLVLAQAYDSLGRARTDSERIIGEIAGRVPVPT
jgi:MoxR-like ATPase